MNYWYILTDSVAEIDGFVAEDLDGCSYAAKVRGSRREALIALKEQKAERVQKEMRRIMELEIDIAMEPKDLME